MKNYLLFATIVTSLFFGCSTKKEKKPATVITKILGKVNTDSVAPPIVTMITAANAPQYIKAAPPTIEPLSYPYGVGVPTIINYGIADGLSGTLIPSSAIDQQGNIWFATMSGLSKYDGSSFTNYNSENGLHPGFVICVFNDSKNNIWTATSPGGPNIFDGKHFSSVLMDKKITPEKTFINTIMEDNRGTIWFTTSSQGLYTYKDKVFTNYTTADGLADMKIFNVIQDKNGDMLISTYKGITRYDGKMFTPYLSIPVNKEGKFPILSYCDSKGSIWFADQAGGLGKYDGKQIKIYTKEDGFNNRYHGAARLNPDFLEDKKGNFWIGGRDGLTKFDGNRFINYTEKDGLASNKIASISEDAYGNIWAGTEDKGISKISNADLVKMEKSSPFTNGVAIDKLGNKWVFRREGLGKFNSDHIAFYGKELSYPLFDTLRIASFVFIDHADNIWFQLLEFNSKLAKLIKFDGTGYTFYGKDQGLSHTSIYSIMGDDANNIWLTGNSGGVTKFDGTSFTNYGSAQGLISTGIRPIFQDSKNNIWFATYGDGVFKYDGHHFTNYTTRDGLPHNNINDIAEDGSGNIWLATNVGAAKFDGKKFTGYKAKDGLDNTIRKVEYDSINKCIWFGTGIGMASLKMDQVNEEKPFFQQYNPRTGFDFSTTYDITIDKQGIVWSKDGSSFFRFDYNSISNSKPIPLQIRNIRLDNKNISWNTLRKGAYPVGAKDSLTAINEMALKFGNAFLDEDFQVMKNAFGKVSFDSVTGSEFIPINLVLPIKNNNISFDFGSISTSFGKAILYQYKLEGYDKNWSELSNKTEASFGNMSEGNYTFHVKALSPFGSWSETNYSFKVLPPWWRTWWAYALYILLFALGIYTFIRWRTKALQKEKIILEEKVITRTSELKESLEHLKSTQSRLIQAEKMASLGELTAGIAHEIQNPLNFVNNFSEVNEELLTEMKDELSKGKIEDAIALANDVIENQKKINHHGKRAGDIVKGMLQHSSSSSGKKEPTDINKLADEYLRLAYHGLRAKNKSLNATMKTEYDETIGNISIIPQDIGRVILNLITNAFYVVNEKKNQQTLGGFQTLQEFAEYEPTVSVSTKKSGDKVLILVKDNGNGIPQKILDKIFQPFFTTKPTGQGTGLGLSLSYDIIKAHGGELKVETKEGEGSKFIIVLPFN